MPASTRSSASRIGTRGRRQRTRRDLLDQDVVGGCADVLERRGEAGRDLAARLVGDERDPLVRLDRQADFDGVVRARASSGENGPNTVAVGTSDDPSIRR